MYSYIGFTDIMGFFMSAVIIIWFGPLNML